MFWGNNHRQYLPPGIQGDVLAQKQLLLVSEGMRGERGGGGEGRREEERKMSFFGFSDFLFLFF